MERIGFACAKVFPLILIVLMIVKFFGSTRITDISPALVTDGMVVLPKGRNCNMLPIGIGIFEKRL